MFKMRIILYLGRIPVADERFLSIVDDKIMCLRVCE